MKPRRLLSSLLKFLSKWAISKHKLRIAVVVGTSGTKITAELFGEMLAKDHVVRKQLEVPFWDFSIPLAILGIDDKIYSFWGWFDVIIEALKVLIFGRSNPGWVVLQMNSLKNEIVEYWLEIVVPDIAIISNYNGEIFPIEEKVALVAKKIVCICSDKNNISIDKKKVLSIGMDKNCDVIVEKFCQNQHGTKFIINYRRKKQRFIAAQTGIFMKEPILSSIAGLIVLGKDLEDISDRLLRAEISIERFIHE
ncbi:MAG: hypothetical protein ABIC57_02175 [bacterium]